MELTCRDLKDEYRLVTIYFFMIHISFFFYFSYNSSFCVILSQNFKERISMLFEKGYYVAHVKAGYIIVWRDKEDMKNYRVVFPDIILKRKN